MDVRPRAPCGVDDQKSISTGAIFRSALRAVERHTAVSLYAHAERTELFLRLHVRRERTLVATVLIRTRLDAHQYFPTAFIPIWETRRILCRAIRLDTRLILAHIRLGTHIERYQLVFLIRRETHSACLLARCIIGLTAAQAYDRSATRERPWRWRRRAATTNTLTRGELCLTGLIIAHRIILAAAIVDRLKEAAVHVRELELSLKSTALDTHLSTRLIHRSTRLQTAEDVSAARCTHRDRPETRVIFGLTCREETGCVTLRTAHTRGLQTSLKSVVQRLGLRISDVKAVLYAHLILTILSTL